MAELLTLGISETKRKQFKIITYDLQDKSFVPLLLNKTDFFDKEGNVIWDLFAITKVENYRKPNKYLYEVEGQTQLVKYLTKSEMKDFFDERKIKAKRFFNSRKVYGIVQARAPITLHSPLRDQYGRFTHRIDMISGLDRYERILIKDYRWLSYWEKLPSSLYEEKIKKWETFFTESDKSIYLLFYRHTFSNGNQRAWIAGFHCI